MPQTHRDVRPCEKEPITGQPIVCSECGSELDWRGLCEENQYEDSPTCNYGNCHADYNDRVKHTNG